MSLNGKILIAIIILLVIVTAWALCSISSDAEDRAEKMYIDYLKRKNQKDEE